MKERRQVPAEAIQQSATRLYERNAYPLKLVLFLTTSSGIVGRSATRASYQKKTKNPTMAVESGIIPHGRIGEFERAMTNKLELPMMMKLPLRAANVNKSVSMSKRPHVRPIHPL